MLISPRFFCYWGDDNIHHPPSITKELQRNRHPWTNLSHLLISSQKTNDNCKMNRSMLGTPYNIRLTFQLVTWTKIWLFENISSWRLELTFIYTWHRQTQHIVSWEPEGCYCSAKDVLLRTRRALLLYKVNGNSALLVLNETSLNCNNALLALNWWYVIQTCTHTHTTYNFKLLFFLHIIHSLSFTDFHFLVYLSHQWKFIQPLTLL